jgi:predicted glycosyltransferase
MADRRPALLLHCQHSLGLGHLVRSLALAEALAGPFRVTVLCGGEVPAELPLPRGIDVVALPPLGGVRGALVSRDAAVDAGLALELRRERVLAAFRSLRPAAVVVELFPFGRRKLAGELVPLLEGARAAGAVTACSVRDLLVARDDAGRHDERASLLANELLDAVLVHADPRFARLDETFRPHTPLAVPVHHTGFVVRGAAEQVPEWYLLERGAGTSPHVVVSAGGGRVGGELLRAAAAAHRLLAGVRTTIVAGPFLPEEEWLALPRGVDGLELLRAVPDLGAVLQTASASVSQCGYNTALDVLRAGVPALVVPFAAPGEDEQARRAERLASLGAVRALEPTELDPARLAGEIEALLRFHPRRPELDLDGAGASALILERLVHERLRGAA